MEVQTDKRLLRNMEGYVSELLCDTKRGTWTKSHDLQPDPAERTGAAGTLISRNNNRDGWFQQHRQILRIAGNGEGLICLSPYLPALNSFDGFTHSSDTISFDVTDTSGTWASASNVLTANSDGFDAAAHIFVTPSPANAANGAIATGFAA